MNSQLSFAVAQSRQQDMLREAQAARLTAEVATGNRRSRLRLTMPRLRLAGHPAPTGTTIASA